MLYPADYFDLSNEPHADLFQEVEYVWDALKVLNAYLDKILPQGRHIEGDIAPTATLHGDRIYIGKGTVVEDGAYIAGPAWIGENCEIRQTAYIRGEALISDKAVLGHSGEMKHSIMLKGAKAPHFAYVGDSILGRDVNLGAGTKLSNLTVVSVKDKATGKRPTLKLRHDGEEYDTGLAKMGAIIGDDAQTGCNSVTNPGCLIGPRSLLYPNTALAKGFWPADSMLKLRQVIEVAEREQ